MNDNIKKTSAQELADFGQSLWFDYVSHSLLRSGRLNNLICQGIRGMTSNPAIFEQAIAGSGDYDEQITKLSETGKSVEEIYDELTVTDIREAADAFLPVYRETKFWDGYVSLEINPRLANKADESVREGLRLFKKVDRPNLMIKVPATTAGFHIVEELLANGINVNVTLIFSQEQYWNNAWAYFKGMNRLSHKENDLSRVRSVASVFVSRVDATVDKLMDEKIKTAKDDIERRQMVNLKGKAAVANAQLIFHKFGTMFSSDMFNSLKLKNAQIQRVLWASTGTKNPEYSDIKYISELIAKSTVNTLPEKTLLAFLERGVVQEAFSLKNEPRDARTVMAGLASFGIDVNKICEQLQADGVASFEKSFDALLASIRIKTSGFCLQQQ